MVLGFKTQFVEKIITGCKVHTIREDKHDRWNPGMEIQFACGVRTKAYRQFHSGKCVSVQKIEISNCEDDSPTIKVDGQQLGHVGTRQLTYFDGFDTVDDFRMWFRAASHGEVFTGKLIHWTSKRY